METNQKRQLDSQPARDALPPALPTKEGRPAQPANSGGHFWQRLALGAAGVAGLGSLLILQGCPANLENPERFADAGAVVVVPGQVPACVTTIFKNSCGSSVCHDKNSLTNDLDLESDGVGARLIDVPATHSGIDFDGGGMVCTPAKYIDTANRPASWLLAKITGKQGTCGEQMPLTSTSLLPAADLACLTSYIDAATGTGTGGTSSGGAAAMTGGTGGAAAATGGGGASAGGTASGGASGSAGTGGM